MSKALVVLSGGQDSTTTLFKALEVHNEKDIAAITFDYQQRHRLEIRAATQIAALMNIPHEIIVLPERLFGGNSPLTDKREELEIYTDFESMEKIIGDRIEKTFVPGRNLLFLSIAATIAAGRGFGEVWTGVCQEDNANYPDCRAPFIEAFNLAVARALGEEGSSHVRILAPLLYVPKEEGVRYMAQHADPRAWRCLGLSHTCYQGTFPPCGVCHSCVLRAEAFERAGVVDPLLHRAYVGD